MVSRILLGCALIGSLLGLALPAHSESLKLNCRLIPSQSDKAVNDWCSLESSGRLGNDRFSMPKQVTLTWSDGIRTRITFLGEDVVKPNVYVGIARVDNSYASFIKAGDGGVCLKILANENSICYR